ncbi:MAG: glycerate kinase [Candidatus Hadarchaeum sp.]|uniref:glycerate kinase type-2 family protein n=1 Tax=Candidatus Hadarchaeum sp. TaxID=2883567 RepID=UPI0031807B0F
MLVKNRKQLLSHGNKKGRKIALDIVEHALKKLDSYNIVKKLVRVHGGKLFVGDLSYDLSKVGDIFVMGAGKGTLHIAKALNDVLGMRIKEGIIIEKRIKNERESRLGRIRVLRSRHPVPDRAGWKGAKEIWDALKSREKNDLVFFCVAGGCSALMPLPVEGVSLEDKARTTELLLRSGATIDEINAVRNHISAIKGGRLALRAHPAEIINLIVVDEVAGLPWGPTVPDTSTFDDAIHVLRKYGLWDKVPTSVRDHLKRSDLKMETPKPESFKEVKFHNFLLADIKTACEAAKERAEEIGLNSQILSTVLEGESKDVGFVLAGIAKEVEKYGRPLNPPCVLIAGGETTVTIEGKAGEGGRNQELAAAFSTKIAGNRRIAIAAVNTDGTDGLTEVAGGMADGYSVERARELGMDVSVEIRRHNTGKLMKRLKDAIITGPTGTNVMDLIVIVVV